MQASLRGMEWRQQQQQQPPSPAPMPMPPGNAPPFQVNSSAQEVCVIQRTVRQDRMAAAANLINFGGLEGGMIFKPQQQQQQAQCQSNQLLALVQQQQQQQQQHQKHHSVALPSPSPFPPAARSSAFPTSYLGDGAVKAYSLPRTSSFGRVSALDVHGLPVHGELLLTEKPPLFDARLEIICSCHGLHLPVSKFVQHINASHAINPGSAVFMDNGQSLLQWRKTLFARLGVKIDDDAGWEWSDPSEVGRSSMHLDVQAPDSAYLNSPFAPAALNCYNNYHFQALHRRTASQSHFTSHEHFAAKPPAFLNQSSSEYFEFINPGGIRSYTSGAAEQQQHHHPQAAQQYFGVGEKVQRMTTSDHGRAGELRPDVSSIELRLGQPSQQAHKARSQYQFQGALEPSFHMHDYGLHAAAQQQQRSLEKVNVLTFNQFGPGGLEKTVFCERAKLWTESANQAIHNEAASRVNLETLSASQEYPLDQMVKARQYSNMIPGSDPARHQASSSQTTWTLTTSRVESGCSERVAMAAASDVLPCYARRQGSSLGDSLGQQHHQLTASPSEDRDSVRILEARKHAAGCTGVEKRVVSDSNPPLGRRAPNEHAAALADANKPANFSNLVRDDLRAGQHEDVVFQASSGALVGENEFPVSRCHLGTVPVSQPFEWKASKSSLLQDTEQEAEAKRAKERLLSDISTKSSENVLGGLSDARHSNEESSTLESESQKGDVVDQSSGVEKCNSGEECFADKTTSTEPRDSVERGETSCSMMEELHASAGEEEEEAIAKVDTRKTRRSRSIKWKSVNSACMSSDSETSKETPPQQTNARASKRRPRKPQRFVETDAPRHAAARRGPSRSATGKMMSINAIMENSKKACEPQSAATLPKQTRKRKLIDLCPAPSNGPVPVVIPRGERSPRGGAASRKVGVTTKEQSAPAMVKVPKRKRAFQVVEEVEPAAASTKRSRHPQPASASHSCLDELPAGSGKVKWKSLSNDSLADAAPSSKPDPQDSCSVCGSSSGESHNQLVQCSSCQIKVHQACYGVPKVPKGSSSWCCRPCKSNAVNNVCVLCGYGGGAMTRAQQARSAVQDLLKVWDTRGPGVRRSSRQSSRSKRGGEEQDNSVTATLGDPNAPQWIHMVCALWMPGTRCLNMETMSSFDVSGVSAARRRLTCSICKRQGGSCIQCNEAKCAVPLHPWCAHTKGFLHIEAVNDTDGHVRFHGKCSAHHHS